MGGEKQAGCAWRGVPVCVSLGALPWGPTLCLSLLLSWGLWGQPQGPGCRSSSAGNAGAHSEKPGRGPGPGLPPGWPPVTPRVLGDGARGQCG